MGKTYSKLSKIRIWFKKHFLLYSYMTEVQQYHFVLLSGMLFITFYGLEFYFSLLTLTLSTAKSLQWGNKRICCSRWFCKAWSWSLSQTSHAQWPKVMKFWEIQNLTSFEDRVGQDRLLYLPSNFSNIFRITIYSGTSSRGFVPQHQTLTTSTGFSHLSRVN